MAYLDTKRMHHDELQKAVIRQDFLKRDALGPDGLTSESGQVAMQWNMKTHLVWISLDGTGRAIFH